MGGENPNPPAVPRTTVKKRVPLQGPGKNFFANDPQEAPTTQWPSFNRPLILNSPGLA